MAASLKTWLLAGSAALVLGAVSAGAQSIKKVDTSQPVLFEADRLIYDTDGKTVRLTGGVEASSDGRVLNADEVSYNQATGQVIASGHVVIREADGSTLTADRVELTGDLKDGLIENIAIILDEHTKLAAARGTREGGERSSLESAVFSPCKICVEDGQTEPLWQIKAVRVIWDEKAKRISYEDATFEFFGTPLLAIPAFSHADFTVKNQSGFLAPTAGQSSDLGYFVEIPYHSALDPSYDLTLSAMIATSVNPVIKADFRQRTSKGSYYLSGSLTYDDAFDGLGLRTGEQTTYGHIFGSGRFEITEKMGWGFDLERTSSDTYLERYEITNADRLTSQAYWYWRSGRSFAIVSAYAFQGLRATDDPGKTPLVLPDAELHYVLDDAVLFASARGDAYRLNDPDPIISPGVESGDILSRFTGYAGVEMRWPFVRQSEGGTTQIVEPIAQIIVAPYGNGPDGIPNEDSLSLEFDDTNLFNPIKFSGLDLVESGPRANIGLRYAEFFPAGGSLEVLAGFQARLDDDPSFLNSTGLGETQSDYVGRVSFTPWPGLTIVNRLRLDKDDFSIRRNEIYVQGTVSIVELDASYLKLESDPTLTQLGPREEVTVKSRIHVSDYWSVIGGVRRDLENDQMVESRFGVAYEDECSFFELGFRRRFTRDRDAEPSTTVILSLRLKALGDDGTAAPLFERDPSLDSENRDSRDFSSF